MLTTRMIFKRTALAQRQPGQGSRHWTGGGTPSPCITSFCRKRACGSQPSAPSSATRPRSRGSRTTFCLSRLLQMRDVAQAHRGASRERRCGGRWRLCNARLHGTATFATGWLLDAAVVLGRCDIARRFWQGVAAVLVHAEGHVVRAAATAATALSDSPQRHAPVVGNKVPNKHCPALP